MLAFIDFETRGDVDLAKCGVHKYVQSPNFDVSCLCFSRDVGEVFAWDVLTYPAAPPLPLLELFAHVANGGEVVAHNAPFELEVWAEMHRRSPNLWPQLTAEQTICTMAMARAMSMPAALKHLAPAMRLKVEKDLDGHKLMLKLCKPRKPRKGEPTDALLWNEEPADLARQIEYCKRDVEVERLIYAGLPKLTPRERQVWVLDQKINNHGIRIDVASAGKCHVAVKSELDRLNSELADLTDGDVKTANSAVALKRWLARWGVDVPDLRKDTVQDVLLRADLEPHVRRAVLIRQEAARSSTGKLAAMVRGTCADGRARGLMQYHGASTGRWIGARINPLNMPRTPEAFSVTDAEETFFWIGE